MRRTTRTTRAMMVTGSLALFGGLLLLGGQPAQGEPAKARETREKFRQLDKNNSGQLERDEFPGDDTLFRRADRDGSETVTFEEALAIVIETEVEKAFMAYDLDRDGVITKAEVTEEKHRQNFEKADLDGDGALTGEELLAAMRAQFQGRVEPASAGPKLPPTWEVVRETYDKNGDGAITLEETEGRARRTHPMLDADGDGRVTEAEYSVTRSRVVRVVTRVHELKSSLERGAKTIGEALDLVDVEAAEGALTELEGELEDWLREAGASRPR